MTTPEKGRTTVESIAQREPNHRHSQEAGLNKQVLFFEKSRGQQDPHLYENLILHPRLNRVETTTGLSDEIVVQLSFKTA